MTRETSEAGSGPLQSLPVYCAADFTVVDGANLGDPIMEAAELVFDDTYELTEGARPRRLAVLPAQDGAGFDVAEGTEYGTPGARIYPDSVATFMRRDGVTVELVLLVEISAEDSGVEEVFILPMTSLEAKTGYRLIGTDMNAAPARIAEVACVSFTKGTHITMADGRQVRIEDLRPGDRVLTRDSGPQVIRWIGASTVRAAGEFAPILIAAGTLHNEGDLLVSPNHRLFVYQRQDELGLGRAEVLVKARHLVNGENVTRAAGGFVDYYQLLFDSHQIIYAEGIAAESLLLDTRTRPAIPPEIAAKLAEGLAGGHAEAHAGLEVPKTLVGEDAVAKLRRASTG